MALPNGRRQKNTLELHLYITPALKQAAQTKGSTVRDTSRFSAYQRTRCWSYDTMSLFQDLYPTSFSDKGYCLLVRCMFPEQNRGCTHRRRSPYSTTSTTCYSSSIRTKWYANSTKRRGRCGQRIGAKIQELPRGLFGKKPINYALTIDVARL